MVSGPCIYDPKDTILAHTRDGIDGCRLRKNQIGVETKFGFHDGKSKYRRTKHIKIQAIVSTRNAK